MPLYNKEHAPSKEVTRGQDDAKESAWRAETVTFSDNPMLITLYRRAAVNVW
jgi:hypothetical protein